MNIRKTDGSLEEYSKDKIIHGITCAYESIGEEVDESLIKNIADNLFVYENMTSAEIRRLVENALMSVNKKVAREYMKKYDTINSDINFKKKKSDFIKNYIEASNAATGSKFDANANVSNKNVVTMGTELYKEENIKENRYLLYDRIKMMYSKKLADRYIYDLETHRIYKHDETAIPGMPYTYSSKEVVEVKYGERHLFVPFDLLWNIVEEESVLVNENDNVYQKRPENLYVKDKGNVFTKVSVITKKERKRDIVRVKTAFGEDVVVTDNHPMIINKDDVNDTVEAIHSEGMTQFKTDESIVFDGTSVLDLSVCPNIEHFTEKYCMTYSHNVFKRYLNLDEKFGYFVGFFVGDGNFNNSKNNGSIVITQKNRVTLEKLNDIFFESLGVAGIIRYKRDKTNCYTLTISNDIVWWILDEYFMIQDKSENKTLPANIFELNENFAKGVVSGLIDSDGTINDCQLSIRLSSRSAIVQTTSLLRHFGYGVGNTIQRLPFGNNGSYKTRYTLWGVNASVRNDSVKLELCEKLKNVRISETSLKYKKSGETIITSVEKINDEDSFLGLNDFIYDITTDTRTFSCNNILVHNCVAITMYPFLVDGLTGLGGQSTAPTDLKSFCGEFINLVYSVSSQFAGAVATPEFLMYFDYFLRKDYGDDYLLHLNDKVEFNTKGRTLEQVIENGFQQIVHSMNMPAGNRGYQCVREDTTQLMTPNGFKYLSELNEGDCCYVWKDGKLCIEKINKLNVYDFDGEMYQFKGRNYQQTVTDSHRVLYKKPNTSTYSIKEAKDLFGHSKLSLPIGSDGIDREDFPITDELLKLCVITLTDGSIDGVIDGNINSGRIKIYKSKNRWGFKEIPELLNSIGVGFTENEIYGNEFGDMVSFTIPKIDSQIILRQIEHTKKRLPKFMKLLSKRQIDIVIDTWSKTDGSNRDGDIYLQCDNDEILNDLQEIVFLGGYGSMIKKSVVNKFNGDGNTLTNHLHIFKRKDKRVSEYNKVYYKGRVWCPSTDAGIVIFREENGIPYITGNSVFWNVGYFDKGYFDGVFGDFKFPDGTAPKWETLSWLQKKFMRWFNQERTKYVLTFPVETMACLTDGNDLVDEEYADFTAEMYADGHSFFTYLSDSPDSLSSCCRLRNSLKDNEDEEHNHNTHQFSMGTASVATGSKSVMTINLNRIVQNSIIEFFEENGDKFELGNQFFLNKQNKDLRDSIIEKIKTNITECTENVHRYQTAFNSIIKDFYEANMLDVYRAGFINMRKQYLTVGVNGLTDAAEFLGIECTDNDEYREFVNIILETINIANKKDKTRDCMFNTEFVPGENLSNKNYNWDKKDGYFVSEKHIMYSSYFFNPEDDSLSVLEKMRLHGKDYVQYLDGGSACHINLAEHLSKEQNRKLLKYAASVGCNYFTYNVRNTACNKCGYISKHDLDKCPHCGSTDVDKLTRIIGYLKRVKSFAEPRQIEEGMRYYNKSIE